MYVIGGIGNFYEGFSRRWKATNEIWASSDGSHWHQVLPRDSIFEERYYHNAIVYDGRVWVFGGYFNHDAPAVGYFPNHTNIWYSSNMKTWHLYQRKNGFNTDLSLSSSYVFNSKLWVFGGFGYEVDTPLPYYSSNKIWSISSK